MKTATQSPVPAVNAKRRHYDEQFKRNAVTLLEGGRRAIQLARELGISQWNLRDWKERYGADSHAGPDAAVTGPVAVAVELADLRRELAAVTGQRDLLKKPWPSLPRSR